MSEPTPDQSPPPEPIYANPSGMITVRRDCYPTTFLTQFREERIAASPGALAQYFYGHAAGLHGPLTIGTYPVTFEDGDWHEVRDSNGKLVGWADGPLLSREEARARIHAACKKAEKRLAEMSLEERRECGRAAYEKIKKHTRVDMEAVDSVTEVVKETAEQASCTHKQAALLLHEAVQERGAELQNEWAEVQAELNKKKPRKNKPGRIIKGINLICFCIIMPVLMAAIDYFFGNSNWDRYSSYVGGMWATVFTVWVTADKRIED